MEHYTKINAFGNKLVSYTELRRRLADQIEKQRKIIKGLEDAYDHTYRAERDKCRLKREDFN